MVPGGLIASTLAVMSWCTLSIVEYYCTLFFLLSVDHHRPLSDSTLVWQTTEVIQPTTKWALTFRKVWPLCKPQKFDFGWQEISSKQHHHNMYYPEDEQETKY